MRIGIHTSTSGALVNAAHKAVELGANCFQIFSASPRMWRATPPEAAQVAAMKAARAEHDLRPLVIHDSYLINLASADAEIRGKSIAAFRGELTRAIAIGAEYLVMHPGSAKGHETLEQALETLTASLEQAARGLKSTGFTLLFENTAGGGASIGRTLEELKTLAEMAGPRLPFPTGYCLDTCHLYAAGYDVATEKGLAETVKQAANLLGLERVPVIHTNDSKGELGSRLDRHENIGKGHIGREGFRRILNHPKLRDKAFILETPIDNEGDDQRNVDTLKRLCRKPRTTTKKSK
ncbi:MAG: deoxyribonuclease IV [Bryobacteraceae bacterium]|jgi:deoxyribonuclease-4